MDEFFKIKLSSGWPESGEYMISIGPDNGIHQSENYQKLREASMAIYGALADLLESTGVDNVPSMIDQLTGQYLDKYADMWKGYKVREILFSKNNKEVCDKIRNNSSSCFEGLVNGGNINDYLYYKIKATTLDKIEKGDL